MKKSLKKLTALGLAFAMTASMAACGSQGSSSEEGGADGKEHVELTGMVQQSRWYSGLQAMVEKLELS